MKLHLRFGGRSRSFQAEDLGLHPQSSDQEIKRKLSRFYDLPLDQLTALVIDRHPDGVVVRPPAVFG